jgi:hypothetical protein
MNMARTNTKTRLSLESLEARRLMSVYADFNGDGFDDLAIGVPYEDGNTGLVQVLYGTASGLTATGSQSWGQTILGTDSSEPGDYFGFSMAGGDFNNDGFADLAVGVPGEDVGSAFDAGAVHLILGSASGLTGSGDKLFHQDSNRVRDIAETGDQFGATLSAGDYNGDGFMDLAVGVRFEDVGANGDAGMVQILYGAVSGLIPGFNPPWTLDNPNIPGDSQLLGYFGYSLASGDFNNDGQDDLAIGLPAHDTSNTDDGGVCILYGSAATGLTTTGSQLWHQDSPGVPDLSEELDQLGWHLAAGDFNGDGRCDIAISANTESLDLTLAAGAVTVLYGSDTGISADNAQFWTQDTLGGPNQAESFDGWGYALAAGDTTNDGIDDLYVSAINENTAGAGSAGVVNVLRGTVTGLAATALELTQETSCAGDISELDDFFGFRMSLADFDGDGDADLAVAVPSEDIGTADDAGMVCIDYSNAGPANQNWTQDTPGIFDTAEEGDYFGSGLDAGAGRDNGASRDPALLITADVDLDTPINKLNKRRNLSDRR